MTTIAIPHPLPEAQARAERPELSTAAAAVVTWAESSECTCPEVCERDHEQD